jgi:hypothetical protein
MTQKVAVDLLRKMEPSQRSGYCRGVCVCVAEQLVEIRAKLESGDLEMLGHVGRPLGTPSKGKTIDFFFQFESLVKLSEVCSKYEQLGQLVGVQTQRLVALRESGTNDDFLRALLKPVQQLL